jgi:hypothetical protein
MWDDLPRPDPDRVSALIDRINDACQGETNGAVVEALCCTLGNCVGLAFPHRAAALAGVIAALRLYVSEIPPLASDGTHAA